MESIKIYFNARDKKRLVGTIKDRILQKKVNDKKHLVKMYGDTPAFQDTIDRYLNEFDSIKVKSDAGYIFKTTKEKWLEHRFIDNLGHGLQYFMIRKYWDIEMSFQKALF